jgi:hypothetical protein
MAPGQHSYATMTRRALGSGLIGALALSQVRRGGAQVRERPYFMPSAKRIRLDDLILKQSWAKTDHARLREGASKGDGFASAFP